MDSEFSDTAKSYNGGTADIEDPRESQAEFQLVTPVFQLVTPEGLGEGKPAEIKAIARCRDHGRGDYEVDMLFPQKFGGTITMWGSDEGFAHMLTGMVRALRPLVVLETGTNRGRSTRAIAEGLVCNQQGMLTTIDMVDHDIFNSGAILPYQQAYVTRMIGPLPDVFTEEPLASMSGIDFAFIDGGHSAKELQADLNFVEAHRASECVVLVDNTRDAGWPEVNEFLDSYRDHPFVNLDTMCGMAIIQMRG